MKRPLSVSQARVRLAIVWLVGMAGIGGLLIVFTIGEALGSRVWDVWDFFWGITGPTAALITGAFTLGLWKPKTDSVDLAVYRVAVALSVIFIAGVGAAIVAGPLQGSLALLENSSKWLRPIQALMSAAVGAFFVADGKRTG